MSLVIEVFLMEADGELHFQAKTGATIEGDGNVVEGTVVGGGMARFT